MSGDGYTTKGDTIVGHDDEKVFRLPDGKIVGGSGDVVNIAHFIEWIQEDVTDEGPKLSKNFEALVLHPDGKLYHYDNRLTPSLCLGHSAIGSGGDFALTAMDMGGDSKKAIEMAILRDLSTGGKITTLKL
jgi:ATP-dependent protease HslVU (ClpYQ) peptidase subunit